MTCVRFAAAWFENRQATWGGEFPVVYKIFVQKSMEIEGHRLAIIHVDT